MVRLYLIPILFVVLIFAVIFLIKNARKKYKDSPCRGCKYFSVIDDQLLCSSPYFEESKVELIPVSKPCKEVHGSWYCDYRER